MSQVIAATLAPHLLMGPTGRGRDITWVRVFYAVPGGPTALVAAAIAFAVVHAVRAVRLAAADGVREERA